MDGAGDALLAGAGFAGDEDIGVALGDLAEVAAQLADRRAFAEQAIARGTGRSLMHCATPQSGSFVHFPL